MRQRCGTMSKEQDMKPTNITLCQESTNITMTESESLTFRGEINTSQQKLFNQERKMIINNVETNDVFVSSSKTTLGAGKAKTQSIKQLKRFYKLKNEKKKQEDLGHHTKHNDKLWKKYDDYYKSRLEADKDAVYRDREWLRRQEQRRVDVAQNWAVLHAIQLENKKKCKKNVAKLTKLQQDLAIKAEQREKRYKQNDFDLFNDDEEGDYKPTMFKLSSVRETDEEYLSDLYQDFIVERGKHCHDLTYIYKCIGDNSKECDCDPCKINEFNRLKLRQIEEDRSRSKDDEVDSVFNDLVKDYKPSIFIIENFVWFVINFRSAQGFFGKLSSLYLFMGIFTQKLSITNIVTPSNLMRVSDYCIKNLGYAIELLNKMCDKFGEFAGTSDTIMDAPLTVDTGKLIGELVGTGLMAKMGFWTPDFNKWFKESFIVAAASTKNIFTLIISVVTQLIEGGQLFWKTGNFRDLFAISGAQNALVQMVDIKDRVQRSSEFPTTAEDKAALQNDIEKLDYSLSRCLIKLGVGHPHYTHVRGLIKDLKEIKLLFKPIISRATYRPEAITFEVWGAASVTKSAVCQELVTMALDVCGYEYNNEVVAYMKEDDKYQSTLKSKTLAVIFDDLGQLRTDKINGLLPLLTQLISLQNVTPSPAVKAALEDKDSVYACPVVIGITTNILDLGAASVVNCPNAIYRRIPFVIETCIPSYLEKGGAIDFSGDFFTKFNKDQLGLPDHLKKGVQHLLYYRVQKRIAVGGNFVLSEPLTSIDINGETIKFPTYVDHRGHMCINFQSMLIIMNVLFKDKRKTALNYRDNISKIETQPRCKECKFPLQGDLCLCKLNEKSVKELTEDRYVDYYKVISAKQDVKHELAMKEVETNEEFKGTSGLINMMLPVSVFSIAMFAMPDHVVFKYCKYSVLWYYNRTKRLLNITNSALNLLDYTDFYSEALTVIENEAAKGMEEIIPAKRTLLRALGVVATFGMVMYFYHIYTGRITANGVNFEPTIKVLDKGEIKELNLPLSDKPPFIYPRSSQQERNPFIIQSIQDGLTKPFQNTTTDKLLTDITKNLVRIERIGFEDQIGGRVQGWFIGERILCTVAHLFDYDWLKADNTSTKTVTIRLKAIGTTYPDKILDRRDVYYPGGDIVYINYAIGNNKCNLLKYCRFVTNDVIPLDEVHCLLLRRDSDDILSRKQLVFHDGSLFKRQWPHGNGYIESDGFKFLSDEVIDGDSGGLVFYVNGNSASIIGIQSAKLHNKIIIQKLHPFKNLEEIYSVLDTDPPHVEQYMPTSLKLQPSKYSILPHLYDGAIEYAGTVENYVDSRSESSFRKSIFNQYIVNKDGLFHEGDRIISNDRYIIPNLRPFTVEDLETKEKIWVSPKNVGLAQSATTDIPELSMNTINLAYQDYIEGLKDLDYPIIDKSMSISDCINGVPMIKGMNKNAAAGYGFNGTFKDYLDKVNDQTYKLKPEAFAALNKLHDQILTGKAPYQIVKANVKDEIIKESKQVEPRIFMSFPWTFTLLSKMYLMPLLTFITQHPVEFETALGVNALGKSWTLIAQRLKQYPYLVDGDYKKFDKKQMRMIMLFFLQFLFFLGTRLKYPRPLLIMAIRCAYMMIYFAVIIGGDIFLFLRSLPSGCLLTIFINCFINCILYRLCWYSFLADVEAGEIKIDVKIENKSFRKSNSLVTFGDDSINATLIKQFDMQQLQERMKIFGQDFTPASKTDIIKPFTDFEDIGFLKRKFKETLLSDGEVYYLCPLEEKSLFKMLAFTDCDVKDEKIIMMVNLIDAHKQYWFYGREVFNERTKFLKDLAHKVGFSNSIGDEESTQTIKWYYYEQIEDMFLKGTLQVQFL